MTEATADVPGQRMHFRDAKPYAIPDDLRELHGPYSGPVELPHSVLWAPGGGRVDLDEPGGLALVYRAVLAEGTAADQSRILHRGRLVEAWADLMLPRRVRQLWEERFPELARARYR